MEIRLGSAEIEVAPESSAVKVAGEGFDATYLTSVKGDPEVLINVYSARKTHENNLLSCGIHALRTNLYFYPLSARTHNCCM